MSFWLPKIGVDTAEKGPRKASGRESCARGRWPDEGDAHHHPAHLWPMHHLPHLRVPLVPESGGDFVLFFNPAKFSKTFGNSF